MNSPAAGPENASPAAPRPSPRRDHKHAGTQHHDRPVRGSLIAPLSHRAMAYIFAADGAVSPARATALAKDARQRVDPVMAVALPVANRRGCPTPSPVMVVLGRIGVVAMPAPVGP